MLNFTPAFTACLFSNLQLLSLQCSLELLHDAVEDTEVPSSPSGVPQVDLHHRPSPSSVTLLPRTFSRGHEVTPRCCSLGDIR
jgi:hypothetical protein